MHLLVEWAVSKINYDLITNDASTDYGSRSDVEIISKSKSLFTREAFELVGDYLGIKTVHDFTENMSKQGFPINKDEFLRQAFLGFFDKQEQYAKQSKKRPFASLK